MMCSSDKGQEKNYAPVCYSGARGSDPNDPYMLSEGEIVKSRGAAKNGYIPVQEVGGGGTIWWFEGWVSAQSLTRATRCVSCKGKGHFNVKCPDCHGAAYNMCSCGGSGLKICKKCWGRGNK